MNPYSRTIYIRINLFRVAWWVLSALVLVLALTISGCGDDDDDDDSADDDDDNDDTAGDDDDNDDDDTGAGPGWDNLSDRLAGGEVRAGFVASNDELIGGPRARGEIGDVKMYNSRIEVIIRSPEKPGVGWMTYSGNIIDADRARNPGEEGADCLLAVEQAAGLLRGFYAKTIEIVETGENGPAVVRVTGTDGGHSLIDATVPTYDAHVAIVNEYILAPNTDFVRIRTTLTNQLDTRRQVMVADIPMWGDETRAFAPRAGFEMGDLDLLANLRWIGGVNRLGLPVSYALATISDDNKYFAPYVEKEVIPLIEGRLDLAPGGQGTYERLFIVGDGDTRMVHDVIAGFDGAQNTGRVSGIVSTSGSTADLMVLVTDQRAEGENFVAALLVDEFGGFSVRLPPGKYTFTPVDETRASLAPAEVVVWPGQDRTVDLSASAPGAFRYAVTDGEGLAVPCRLTFQAGPDAPLSAGIVNRIWDVDGEGERSVLPGTYTVTASRGWEYEIDRQNVVVPAGGVGEFTGAIERVVDTAGYMTGDFHIHTAFSFDSQALVDSRVVELAGEGIEMPVFTDHDFTTDWTPIVERVDASGVLVPVSGDEISPVFGHANAWPLTKPAGASDYFGVRLTEYDDDRVIDHRNQHPDLWDIARGEFGAQVVQINHPRSGSSGWFNWAEYDPAIGVDSANPVRFRDDFDAIEVFNSGDDDEGTLADWFSFLDQGYAYTLTGNSDSHSPGSQLGNPRNVFAMPTDDPADADPQDMVDSILANRNVVSNGPFVSFAIDGEPLGGLASIPGGEEIPLAIRVQAAPWVRVDYVRVYTNHGQVAYEAAVPETEDIVCFDDVVTLSAAADAYFVVETGHSSARLAPVTPGERVFAMTNPIWVDVDGNGAFDEPGL